MAPTVGFDLRLMGPFVALADEDLSFRRAAQRLEISQPRLSQQVTRLQRQLRTRLVIRDERRTVLTPAGSRFLDHARAVLVQADTLADELRAGADTLRLHMGVGAHRSAREAVTSFMTTHPATRVEVAEGLSSDARRSLVLESVDAAFELRGGCPAHARFELLDRSPLGLLAGRQHPTARGEPATWRDLAGTRILFGPSDDGSWNTLVRSCLAHADVRVAEEIAPAMAKLDYLVPIIARGSAAMITGRALFDPLPPGLSWTPLTPYRHLEYGVIWDERRAHPPTRRFVEFVRRFSADSTTPATGAAGGQVEPAPTTGADATAATARPDFDLRLVLPFVTVAEERHFSRAAEKLMIAQPALSRQIARLETQLGVRLLDRSTRTVELTPAGRLALATAREILDATLRAQSSVEPD